VILRGGFAAVVFAALLSVGLGYAVRSTSRGGDGPVAVGEWWVDLLGAWEAFAPDFLDALLFSLLPTWLGYAELTGIVVLVFTLIVWAGAEARWAGWTVESALEQIRSFRGGETGDGSSSERSADAEDAARPHDDCEDA
jgi:hypothetical protein